MKLPTKELKNALATVGKFTSPNSPFTQFTMVSIDGSSGVLKLSSESSNGAIELSMGECDDIQANVDHARLVGVISRLNCGDVEIDSVGNNLLISTDSMDVAIPIYSGKTEVGEASGSMAVVTPDAFCDIPRKLASMRIKDEGRYFIGQRILSRGGELSFTSSTGHNWVSAWCPCSGDDIDLCVYHDSIINAADCIKKHGGEWCYMYDSDSRMYIESGNVRVAIPTANVGSKPLERSHFSEAVSRGDVWQIPRVELRDFLTQAGVFTTEDSTGVWLEPVPEGLEGRFTGVTDGEYSPDMAVTGRCKSTMYGECTGDVVYIRQKYMLNAINAATDDGFRIVSIDRGVVIESAGYMAAVAKMAIPMERAVK